MEINAINIAWNKIFCGKLSTVSNKKVGGRKKTNLVSCLQKQYKKSWTMLFQSQQKNLFTFYEGVRASRIWEAPFKNHMNPPQLVFGLKQVITEPTRITPSSSSLIDLIFTNQPDLVSFSGVSHVGISDHSLIYAF